MLVACAAMLSAIAFFVLASPYLPAAFTLGKSNPAATIRAAKTVTDLHSRYAHSPNAVGSKPLTILIVPGHEPTAGGTAYKNIWERDVVVDIAEKLAERLKTNTRFNVMVARDKKNWHPTLQAYFNANWQAIAAWRDSNKLETAQKIATGTYKTDEPAVHHNRAPEDMSIRLNGVNKWADEQDIDIVLHLHVNDYPRKRTTEPGKYSGFSIYIPHYQYGNNSASRAVAQNIFDRLSRYYPVSDLPGESMGIIEDAELIAIGRDNSQSAASVLVEYGYIYEPQFVQENLRDANVQDLAYQTFLGLTDFFDASARGTHANTLLPYTWSASVTTGASGSVDVLTLQTALVEEGLYPPPGTSLSECPRSGKFGPCTEKALQLFQEKYDIDGDGTHVGPATRAQLNALYGEKYGYQ